MKMRNMALVPLLSLAGALLLSACDTPAEEAAAPLSSVDTWARLSGHTAEFNDGTDERYQVFFERNGFTQIVTPSSAEYGRWVVADRSGLCLAAGAGGRFRRFAPLRDECRGGVGAAHRPCRAIGTRGAAAQRTEPLAAAPPDPELKPGRGRHPACRGGRGSPARRGALRDVGGGRTESGYEDRHRRG